MVSDHWGNICSAISEGRVFWTDSTRAAIESSLSDMAVMVDMGGEKEGGGQ